MEWVASTLHTTSEHGVSSITTADVHTSAEPTPPAVLNGLVRFAERWNLVSARVPSHFKRSLLQKLAVKMNYILKLTRSTWKWPREYEIISQFVILNLIFMDPCIVVWIS